MWTTWVWLCIVCISWKKVYLRCCWEKDRQFLCSVIFWTAVYASDLPHTLRIIWNLKNWNIWIYFQESLKASAGLKKPSTCLEQVNFTLRQEMFSAHLRYDKSPGKPSTDKFLLVICKQRVSFRHMGIIKCLDKAC